MVLGLNMYLHCKIMWKTKLKEERKLLHEGASSKVHVEARVLNIKSA